MSACEPDVHHPDHAPEKWLKVNDWARLDNVLRRRKVFKVKLQG